MSQARREPEPLMPVFENVGGVRAGFSRKGAESYNPDGRIPGLNTGYHTNAPESEVRRNRRRIYQELGVTERDVAWLRQIHSAKVVPVHTGGDSGEADALVTQTRGVVLGIQVADCAALLLVDPVAGLTGAVHAGWRGAVGGVIPNTLQKMVSMGAEPSRMHAWVSPCISDIRFEVGPEVAAHFPPGLKRPGREDRWLVDLKGFVRDQLLNFGLYESRVELHPGCTIRDASRWYSWRREKEKAGRMMALILLENDPLR